jgi:hypothetical protein
MKNSRNNKDVDPKLIYAMIIIIFASITLLLIVEKNSIFLSFTEDQYKEIQFQTEYRGKILEYTKEHGMYYLDLGKNKFKITQCGETFIDNYESITKKLNRADSLFKAANNDTLFVFSAGKRDTILLKFDNEIKKK